MAVKSLAQSTLRQNPQLNSMLGGYQPNAFHHLETVRLGGAASEVNFTNLQRYSDFQHLQLVALGQTFSGSGTDITEICMQINGDTGTNYVRHVLYGTPSFPVTSAATLSQNNVRIGMFTKSTQGAVYGGNIVDILDAFDSSKNTTIKGFGGFYSLNQSYRSWIALESGLWQNTAPVNSLRFFSLDSQNFMSGTRFSLYGIKARA